MQLLNAHLTHGATVSKMAGEFKNVIQGYEDNVKVIGYYCSTCKKDWVLENWNGNTVPNDTKRALQYYHRYEGDCVAHQQGDCVCHFTREDADDFVKYVCQGCRKEWKLAKFRGGLVRVNDDTSGYMCSACMKEWLADDKLGVESEADRINEANMQNLRHHRHSCENFGEVQEDGTVKVTRFVCSDCKKEWLLSFTERQELIDTLKNHHISQGCNSTVTYKGVSNAKQYSCPGRGTRNQCEQKWLLKEIPPGNHELLRRVREMKALWDHHRETGCFGGIQFMSSAGHEECDLETAARDVIGYYCKDCKTEWLSDEWNRNSAPNIEEKMVDHHYIPRFRYLQMSDMGIRVYWDHVQEKLQPGDHIAWQRSCSYWHHAIVEKVEKRKITVIEWTSHSSWGEVCGCRLMPRFTVTIHRTDIDRRDRCCGRIKELVDGPMYKVVYPEAVQMQNPPELVLSRAHSRLNNAGYKVARDNCEHFATFCKTGSHKSGQIKQVGLTFQAWGLKRLVIALIYVTLLAGFAELIEEIFGKGQDYVGLIIIGAVELVHVVYIICVVYISDIPEGKFIYTKCSHRVRALFCASSKIIFKFVFMVGGTALATVVLINSGQIKKRPKGVQTICEIGVSLAGGLFGSAVGFLLVHSFTSCSSCGAWCCQGQVHHENSEYNLGEQNFQITPTQSSSSA